jgi:hypothetical protein
VPLKCFTNLNYYCAWCADLMLTLVSMIRVLLIAGVHIVYILKIKIYSFLTDSTDEMKRL